MSSSELLLFSLGPAIFIVFVLFPALIGLLSQRVESGIKPVWLSFGTYRREADAGIYCTGMTRQSKNPMFHSRRIASRVVVSTGTQVEATPRWACTLSTAGLFFQSGLRIRVATRRQGAIRRIPGAICASVNQREGR